MLTLNYLLLISKMYLHKIGEPTHFSFVDIVTDVRQIKVTVII